MKRFFATMLAAFGLAAAPAPNWSTTVTMAPNGAMVQGNPNAKVRFVEYLSYTCPHCAVFVGEASVPLKRDYVGKGLVAVEMRNAIRDRYDYAAALLARCGPPSRFFGNTELLMAKQSEWLGRAPDFDKLNGPAMAKISVNDSLKLIVRGLGLDKLMATRGLTPAQINACLTDKVMQKRIVDMTNEAWNVRKITGTPTFLINGSALEGAGHWAVVEPALKAALAPK